MSAKPIVVIKIDVEADLGGGISINKARNNVQDFMNNKLPDYHVFVLPMRDGGNDPIRLQVFYEKDFTEIQYEELKSMIQDAINQQQSKEQ